MPTYALIALTQVLLSAQPEPDGAGSGDKAPPTRALAGAVAKANRLVRKMSELDRGVIEQSGFLRGRMSLTVQNARSERHGEDHSVRVSGVILVDSGPAERFKTREEKARLAELSKVLTRAEQDLRHAEKLYREQWRRRYERSGRILHGRQKPGWFHIRTGAHITEAEYEQGLISARRVAQDRRDAAQQEMIEVADPINQRLAAEKKAADEVAVEVAIPQDVVKVLDVVALMQAESPPLIGEIVSYETTNESEQVGGRLRISSVTLKACGAGAALRRRAAGVVTRRHEARTEATGRMVARR